MKRTPASAKKKRGRGRPRKFATLADLERAIEAYFQLCDNRIIEIHDEEGGAKGITVPEPYTIAGLALALGVPYDTLGDWERGKGCSGEYSGAVKRAKLRIRADNERRLFEGKNQAGAIFYAKNAWGMRDTQHVDESMKGTVTYRFKPLWDDKTPTLKKTTS